MRAFGTVLLLLFSYPALPEEFVSGELESFVDGVMAASMEEHHVAGAVVGVVLDDEVLLLKGYGLGDVKQGVPVNADTTLFRVGSVSKLFVWLGLMQLYEQGKIDLHTDINAYLDGIKVPSTFDEPITISHLMTHTPGFEDLVIGLFARDASRMIPLQEIFAREMPERVRPPGTYPSYSNHGVGLAGMILQQVSGEPWETYIERHILQPLQMANTTARQPLPARLSDDMSAGYKWINGRFREQGFEFVPLGPAGGVSASGADMVRMLRMFLNLGQVDGTRVLGTKTAGEMQSVLFRSTPESSGVLHGFYESNSHGQRIFGHGGDTIMFHSELMLIPEQRLGWFISTNSENGARVRGAFRKAFLDRYFATGSRAAGEFARTDLARVSGFYGSLRHAHNDVTRIMKLLGAVTIAPADQGKLMLAGGDEITYFEEVAPLIFKSTDSETRLFFELDENGEASHLYLSQAPVIAFERMSGLQSPSLHSAILVFSFLMFAWIVVVWSVQHFVSRWARPPAVARFRLTSGMTAGAAFLFIAFLASGLSNPDAIVFGVGTTARLGWALAWLVLVLSLVGAALLPRVLTDGSIGVASRFGYFMVALAGLSFSWFLYYWSFL